MGSSTVGGAVRTLRSIGRSRGMLVVGLLLAALGGIWTVRTLAFLDKAVPASGTVAYTTRYTVGVRFQPARGLSSLVSVPKPGLALPGSFRPGKAVAILVDPAAGDEPPLPLRGVFHPLQARFDSTVRLWMPIVLAIGFGALCLTLYAVSPRSPARTRTSARTAWDDPKR